MTIGMLVLSASKDTTLKLWELKTGKSIINNIFIVSLFHIPL